MMPNAGSSASEIRLTRLAKNGPCTGTSAMKSASPAARPAKLHGNASRTATMDGASAMLLQFANHGLDAADDSDIVRVDWLHRRILRLQTDAPVLTIEPLYRRFTVEHRDDDLTVVCRFLRTHDDQIAVENRRIDHRIALHAEHEVLRSACERGRKH